MPSSANSNRTPSRRSILALGGAMAAGLALPRLTQAQSTPVASPATGEWTYTDVIGTTISLPTRPTRIAAYVNNAASLWDFGIKAQTVFGWTASHFPEGDLVPALLAADAVVRLVSGDGRSQEPVDVYLRSRGQRRRDELIARVFVPTPVGRYSAFERITVRKAGEYPLANLSISADVADGVVNAARVGIGSVEDNPRLSPEAASMLIGHPIGDSRATAAAAEALAATLQPRDAVDGPGWYRAQITPVLLRRVVARLKSQIGQEG